ncbi:hypothetical protein EDD18DRAFT_78603 [Armillaria luteobubalina]|uniref:Protein kinase domain-containing protein n=1 Tax=Armillaria luteobubalina TaxID=153913 RepID=A0AA39QAI5_9AGAR|nr:hypothetical protein EDD18DRAFT_78603 [Armillaria luteobubalina]
MECNSSSKVLCLIFYSMSPITPSTTAKRRPASDKTGADALQHLFTRRPTFTKLPGFNGSRDTRGPAHYDTHLHPQLILKDIVSFPDMLDQLSGIVDCKIQEFISESAAKSLPRISVKSALHPARVSEVFDNPNTKSWVIGHEVELQRAYHLLEQYPTVIASTLVAGLKQWSSIFHYSDEKSKVPSTCAIADGYLSLNKSAINTTNIPVPLKNKLRLVMEQNLSDFLFWEFKSMNAGRRGVMLAIDHIIGSEFSWVSCPRSIACGNRFCHKKGNRFRFTVTGHKTGVDGVILEANSNDDNESKGNTNLDFVFDTSSIDCSLIPSVPDTRRWKFMVPKSSKKRVRKESDTGNQDSNDDDNETYNENDDEDKEGSVVPDSADSLPFYREDYEAALKVIQQIWAEAVNIDATFIVLNCGSLEYIGIRDRKLQRLYLSKLLDLDDPDPSKPGYFKIHTGLNIVALLDAIKRAEKLKAMQELPELYTFEYDRSEPDKNKVPKKTKSARRSKSARTPRTVVKETIPTDSDDNSDEDLNSQVLGFSPAETQLFKRLREAPSLKITWKQDIHGLGTASSMRMTRSSSPATYIDTWAEEVEVLVMKQCPNSPLTYSCYLDDGETAVCGIIFKLAESTTRKACLRKEYEMYTKFPSIEGIVQHLGIVEHIGLYQYMGTRKSALVLLDSGDPISSKFGPSRIPAGIFLQVREAVRKMHSAMVTHGYLVPENVLITKDLENEKGGWKVHLISWKDGKDHRESTAVQEAYNRDVLRTLNSRSRKLNWRSTKLDHVPHRATGASSKVVRKRKPRGPKFGVVSKARIKLAVKENLRRHKRAVKADLEKLEDNVWPKLD